jgi:hypothetical protein
LGLTVCLARHGVFHLRATAHPHHSAAQLALPAVHRVVMLLEQNPVKSEKNSAGWMRRL